MGQVIEQLNVTVTQKDAGFQDHCRDQDSGNRPGNDSSEDALDPVLVGDWNVRNGTAHDLASRCTTTVIAKGNMPVWYNHGMDTMRWRCCGRG